MTQHPICPEKSLLLSAYEKATRAYSDAVARLQRIMGVSSKTEYEAQYRMTEALRMVAAEAQQALERHVGTHGC